MLIVKPSHEILSELSGGLVAKDTGIEGISKFVSQLPALRELRLIEKAARTCYRSEDKCTDDGESVMRLEAKLIESGHEAMLEHSSLTVKFVCDRGVSHELVRHRMASFAQESQRYCNYSKGKFNHQLKVICPPDIQEGTDAYNAWSCAMVVCENAYFRMLETGVTPQIARSVLPNATATTIVVTANYREWRHILRLRCAKDAHPQMRELMIPLLRELKNKIPVLFDDIHEGENEQ